MLKIKDLYVNVEDTPILQGINLEIGNGEVHAIMGPNGSGKSTLANVLAGREEYEVISGSIEYNGENILDMDIDERAHAGLFLAFQYPVEIPGVSNSNFLKTMVESSRANKQLPPLKPAELLKMMRENIRKVGLSDDFLRRSLNEGFSGGEKKRNEMLQMLMLDPNFVILDETDSGLDIDALKIIADVVNSMRNDTRSFMVVTHYQRLLDYIVPDYIHIIYKGRIVKSGDKTLALKLEAEGYDWIKEEVDGTLSPNTTL